MSTLGAAVNTGREGDAETGGAEDIDGSLEELDCDEDDKDVEPISWSTHSSCQDGETHRERRSRRQEPRILWVARRA